MKNRELKKMKGGWMVKSFLKKYIPAWPFLFGPATMILVYAAHFGGMENIVSRRTNEYMTLILLN
jgi:hypothetical protein